MNSTQAESVSRGGRAMRWTTSLIVLVVVSAIGLALGSPLRHPTVTPAMDLEVVAETDPVALSFVRDMNREPTPAAPIQRESIADDELYEMINTIRWTTEEQKDGPTTESTMENINDDQQNRR